MIRVAGKFVLHISVAVFGLAAVIIIGLSAAAYRLAQGPVSVGFLVPYVEEALTSRESLYRLQVEDTILTWGGWENTLEIRIRGVRILNKAQAVVATVPEVILDLSGRALFAGMLAPTKLELIGADAKLVRLSDGRVMFGLANEETETASGTSRTVFLNLITRLAEPLDMSQSLGYLHQITISSAILEIYDQPSATVWRGPDTNFTLTRDHDGIRGNLQTGISLKNGSWEIDATGIYDPDRRVINLDIHFGEFEPAVLAEEHEAFAALLPITMPMSGSINFEFGTEGSAPETPLINFDISAGPGNLTLPKFYDEPVPFDNVSLRGRLDQDLGQIVIEDFFALAGTAELSAQGLILYGPEGNGAILDVEFGGLRVENMTRYWPPKVKPKSRNWVVENLADGIIRDGVAKIVFEPGTDKDGKLPEDALDLRFAVEGMTVRYMRSLPLLTNLSAQGHMTTSRLDLTDGLADVGGLILTEGTFSIPDLTVKPPIAEVGLVVKGPSVAATQLLDSEQLSLLGKIGLKAEDVGGQSATRAHLVFPLTKDLTVKDVSFAAAANMGSLTMPTQLDGLRVTDGIIQLRANAAGLLAGGEVALNGVPVAMTWTKDFGKPDEINSRYRLTGKIDDADRVALNILVADYLQGPINGVVEIANQGKTLISVSGRLDLSQGTLLVPPLAWSKPAGVGGDLQFVLQPARDGGFNVDALDFSIKGFDARGQAEFGPSFAVKTLNLDRLTYGETDVSLTLVRTEDNGFEIVVRGSSYDLRPNLEAEEAADSSPADEETGPPITIQARLDKMIIGDNQVLGNVAVSARHTGKLWQEAEIQGVFGADQPLTMTLTSNAGLRNLTFISNDAGSVGRALGIYKNANGGKLTLTAQFDDLKLGRPVTGRLLIDDFRVVNAPLVTRILTIGSLSGILNLLQGEGIKFKRLDSEFSYENKVLKVHNARAFGSAVGFNLEGSLDNKTKFADFSGTVVPAYTVNTVLGKVPMLGDLLLGGKGEGVFAITYAIKGPLEKPRVTVNPLSALAPGFLRGIVSILTPKPSAPIAPAPESSPKLTPEPMAAPSPGPENAIVPETISVPVAEP